MRKAKSLILQEVVSQNPDKILSENRGKKRCEMGKDVGAFLKNVMDNRSDVMRFVMELGENRNRRLGIVKK